MFPPGGSAPAQQQIGNAGFPTASGSATPAQGAELETVDPLFVLEKNRLRIAALRAAIVELESRVNMHKAYSREVLPPMDGVVPPSGQGERPTTSDGREGDNNANIGVADMYSSEDQLMV